jgi:hypothetical protein
VIVALAMGSLSRWLTRVLRGVPLRTAAISESHSPAAVTLAGGLRSELLSRRPQQDLVDVRVRGLLDGERNRAGHCLGCQGACESSRELGSAPSSPGRQ